MPSAFKPKKVRSEERHRQGALHAARLAYCKRNELGEQNLKHMPDQDKELIFAWYEATKSEPLTAAQFGDFGSLDSLGMLASMWRNRALEIAEHKSTLREALLYEKNHGYRRRMRVILATPKWVDFGAIAALIVQRNKITAETGIPHHIDHIIPLAAKNVCGLHVHQNMQIIPARENIAKNNRITLDKMNAEM